jgi:hypothetical protein
MIARIVLEIVREGVENLAHRLRHTPHKYLFAWLLLSTIGHAAPSRIGNLLGLVSLLWWGVLLEKKRQT